MKFSQTDVFGPGFVPGKVTAVRDAASRALGMRWSGLPANDTTLAAVGRPPSTSLPTVHGAKA